MNEKQDCNSQEIDEPDFRKCAAFENYGEYFDEKRVKLDNQFQLDAEQVGQGLDLSEDPVLGGESEENCLYKNLFSPNRQIFEGISAYVNGYTRPSQNVLRKLLIHHGGKFSQYPTKKVSHIIATNLPDSKIKELKNQIIVKPEWIVECVKEGKLLDLEGYELYSFHERTNQKKLQFAQMEKPEPSDPAIVSSVKGKMHMEEDEDGFSVFFGKSRFHHLSSWKNEFVEETRKFMAKKLAERDSFDVPTDRKDTYFYIDMDCFFASVGLLDRPHFQNEPVVVCHASHESDLSKSSSELASCNYIARRFGIKNGMYLSEAYELCPKIKCIPFEYEKYREISKKIYKIFFEYADEIQAISCDEACINVASKISSDCSRLRIEELSVEIRRKILEETACTASIGAAHSILLAKMATNSAKPNGQLYVSQEEAFKFISGQPISALPGIGFSCESILKSMNIENCEQLQKVPLKTLQEHFGEKKGLTIFNLTRGIDDRRLTQVKDRMSISVEVNYGIRVSKEEEVRILLQRHANEVCKRQRENNLYGSHVTLSLKKRSPLAPEEPRKHGGHGICDNLSKSRTFPRNIVEQEDLYEILCKLYDELKVPPSELRGIAICMSKFKNQNQTSMFKYLAKPHHNICNEALDVTSDCSDIEDVTETITSQCKNVVGLVREEKSNTPVLITIDDPVNEKLEIAQSSSSSIVIDSGDDDTCQPVIVKKRSPRKASSLPQPRKRKTFSKKKQSENYNPLMTITQAFGPISKAPKSYHDDQDILLIDDEEKEDSILVIEESDHETEEEEFPSLRGVVNVDDVCALIADWMEKFLDQEPLEEDQWYVGKYLTDLVKLGLFDIWTRIMRMIKRKISTKSETDVWRLWFQLIYEKSQEAYLFQGHQGMLAL